MFLLRYLCCNYIFRTAFYIFNMAKLVNRFFLLFFIIIIGLFSCEQIVEIDTDRYEQQLILNGIFTKDDFFTVRVSKTLNILDTIDDAIKDANVFLYANNIIIDTLTHYTDGVYSSTKTKPQEGVLYTISAENSIFTKIYAENILPSKIIPTKIEQTDNAGVDDEGYTYSQIKINFTDPKFTNDFYEVALFKSFYIDDEEKITPYNLFSNNPIFINEGDVEYHPAYLPFSDELITNENCCLTFNYYSHSSNSTLILHFRTVSEDYYKYKKRLILHLNNQNSDIWDGVGEPIQMYSNIQNGVGIFASYQVSIDTIN